MFASFPRVLIDDGTPRMSFPFRIHLSLTVFRLKQMIEAQEGFTVGEQDVFYHGNPVGSLCSVVCARNCMPEWNFFMSARDRGQCKANRA